VKTSHFNKLLFIKKFGSRAGHWLIASEKAHQLWACLLLPAILECVCCITFI